jgi:hypothetical protein
MSADLMKAIIRAKGDEKQWKNAISSLWSAQYKIV